MSQTHGSELCGFTLKDSSDFYSLNHEHDFTGLRGAGDMVRQDTPGVKWIGAPWFPYRPKKLIAVGDEAEDGLAEMFIKATHQCRCVALTNISASPSPASSPTITGDVRCRQAL